MHRCFSLRAGLPVPAGFPQKISFLLSFLQKSLVLTPRLRWRRSNLGDMELIKAKFDRSLILRVEGEAIVVFTPQSCLLQSKAATALHKVALEHFVQLCGWNWAFVSFEADGLVLRNRNNARARYPLAAALRIEVPTALQCLCAQVRLLLAEAESLESVQRRQSRLRFSLETTANAAHEQQFDDAHSDSDSSGDEDDENDDDDDDDDSEDDDLASDSSTDLDLPRARAARHNHSSGSATTTPQPRQRRARRGFGRVDERRKLFRVIERNSIFPSPELLQKQQDERRRRLERMAIQLEAEPRKGLRRSSNRLLKRKSTTNSIVNAGLSASASMVVTQ
jgi:hypothetical protein